MPVENTYKATCRKDELKHIREFVIKVLSDYAISEVQSNELVLAVDEICANLIIHSCACDPNYSIDLKITKNGSELIFEFTNRGSSFNILSYQEPKIEDLVAKKRKGGLGLILVNRIMDKIEYHKGENCETYRLIKEVATKVN
jgi:serine/threonine-protein kinase RsbW